MAAKTIFARAVVEKSTSQWPEEVYREHIRAFNGFHEREPRKDAYEDFRNSFVTVLRGLQEDDFKHHQSPVVSDKNGMLLNGSHRVAASIVLNNRRVNSVIAKNISPHNWNYAFFGNGEGYGKLAEKYLDAMTIEYVSQKKSNIFAVIIFPSAKGHRKEVAEYLSGLGQIVNVKSIPKKKLSGVEVIRQVYFREEWNTSYDGAMAKAAPCFNGQGNLQVYILETNLDEKQRQQEKAYLRGLWGVGKHSVHITDTLEEVNRVARMFFHENSRRILGLERRRDFSDRIRAAFHEFVDVVPQDFIERDKLCIEGSTVLDFFNIRDANDLDYVTRATDFNYEGDIIGSHNNYNSRQPINLYGMSMDELISSPDNFFYFAGCKFLSIHILLRYKLNRADLLKDAKDVQDAHHIKAWLEEHTEFIGP